MPSVEQGGVSQRSVRPQHVSPFGELLTPTAAGAETSFVSLSLPQFGHKGASSPDTSSSTSAPQSAHLYSYTGIA